MYISKPILSTLYIALIVCIFGIATPEYTHAKTKKTQTPKALTTVVPYTETAIVGAQNEVRRAQKLPILTVHPLLTKAAQRKAQDMVQNGYFDHTTPTGSNFGDFMIDGGYEYLTAGENLAAHYKTKKGLLQGWMSSPIHRANILSSSYSDTGIGMAYGTHQGKTGWIVTQLFGTD